MRIILCLCALIPGVAFASTPFRFHLFAEPKSLDARESAASSATYLIHNLYRGLFRFDAADGLVREGAEKCTRAKGTMTCTLRAEKWSDGSAVTATHYVETFRWVIDPENRNSNSELLFTLKNARKIWDGKAKPEELGVRAKGELTLELSFEEEDPEFEFKLAHVALTPRAPSGLFNGPYVLTEWKKGSWIKLSANARYTRGNPKRPPAEMVFVEEDSTALTLYESGKLDFLRRLTASEIPRFRGKPDFHQFPMARFDYVGFGPQLRARADVRSALVHGVEFKDFLRIFDTRSQPGCPSLPSRLLERVECQDFRPVQPHGRRRHRPRRRVVSRTVEEERGDRGRIARARARRLSEWT